MDYFTEFFDAYVATALWSSTDGAETPLNENYGAEDIEETTGARMKADCEAFIEANRADLDTSGLSAETAGRDFWLTREGHGTGFWDEAGVSGDVKGRLTNASKAYGEFSLSVDDDFKIRG